MTNKKETFEESLDRLKEIAERLECDGITIDESIELYEEGIILSKFCFEKLKDAELKITELKNGLEEALNDSGITE